MPIRSRIDQNLPSAYTAEAAVANPSTSPGVDNRDGDAVTHFLLVKTGAAGAVATIWDSDDNATFAPVADPSFIQARLTTDTDLSTAGVKMLAYVGPKRYSAVRFSGGTPTVSTFGLVTYLHQTTKIQSL